MTSRPYEKTYAEIIDTNHGAETLLAVRQAVASFDGEFSAADAINKACSIRGCVDTWNVLNALDHLITEVTIRELTNPSEVMGQDRRFVCC